MGTAASKSVTVDSQFSSDRSVIDKDMSCEACRVRFTVLKRKKNCSECSRNYCTHCAPKVKSGSARRCERCQFLVSGHFDRADLQDYKVKEIRQFLTKRCVAVDNCREKNDLIDLLMQYANNSQYRMEQQANERRREELQARARTRDSLGSTSVTPRPPPYDTLFNASRDQNSGINLVEDHFSNENTSSRDQIINQSRDHLAEPSNPSPAQSRAETISCDPPIDQSRDPEPIVRDSSNIPRSQNEGQPTENVRRAALIAENLRILQTSSTSAPPGDTSHLQQKEDVQATPEPQKRKKTVLSDVTCIEDIETLTARQLKELLERNYVDYKGCVEKHELVTRVTRLWNDNQKNVHVADELNIGDATSGNSEICKICMDALVDCVLLDCGHMLTCTTCGKQLAECPICRQYIVRVVHVFKS